MTIKECVVLAIVCCVFSVIREINGAAIDHPKADTSTNTISEEIKSDKEICKTGSVFGDSRWVKSCEKLDFPTNNVTLSPVNSMQFLCLGLYDRMARLCYLGSTAKLGNTALPDNSTAFDLGVEKSFSKDSTDAVTFCKNWENRYPPRYNKIKMYVEQLERALRKESTCLKICATFDEGKLEPMCAVLASMDEISEKMFKQDGETAAKTGPKTGPEINSVTAPKIAPENSPQIDLTAESAAQPSVSKDSIKIESKQEKIDNNKDETPNSLEKHGPEASDVSKATEGKIAVTPLNSSHLKRVESKETPVNKVSQSPAQISVEATAQQPSVGANEENKNADPETLKEMAQNSLKKSLDDRTVVDKPVLAKKNPADPAPQAAGKDQANGDNSQEETDKIPALVDEPNDPKTDLISERTQDDEPLGGGGDPSEDANEIEPPINSNEDTNENPVQPLEKREHISRLPGMRNDDDSHFFGYFTVIGVICIAGYVGYHNKQKILAMVLEGRRSRGGRGRRRPSTANYRKLDCTLEEAVTSQCNSNVTHVIY